MIRTLALVLLGGSAFGGTVSQTVTVPTLHNFDQTTVQVAGFDRVLGHLDSITFARSMTTSGTVAFENVDPWDTGYFIESWIALSGPVGTFTVAVFSPTAPIGAFDGAIDYAGTSGVVAPIAGSVGVSENTYSFDYDTMTQAFLTLTIDSGGTVGVVTTETWQTELVNVANDYTFTLTYNFTPYPEQFCSASSGVLCPCGALSFSTNGCPNSASTVGAHLNSTGTAQINGGTFSIYAQQLPANTMGLLFDGTHPNYWGATFGDGTRCVGGSVRRLAVQQAVNGTEHFTGPFNATPGYRAYQLWYRDPAPGFCTAATFNLTNAVGTVWTP